MEEFVDVGSVSDLPVGRSRGISMGGRKIALHHAAAGWFASGVCTGNTEVCVVTHQVKVEGDRVLVRLAPVSVESESL